MNTHYNKITAQFSDRESAMNFADWATKNCDDFFNNVFPAPEFKTDKFGDSPEEEAWVEENWGCYYLGDFKMEWKDWASNTIILRFRTKYGCPKEFMDKLVNIWDGHFMLEHFCPEENWLCRYVWDYDAQPFDVTIDDLQAEQARLINDLDSYGLRWDIISERDNGEYCFHIESAYDCSNYFSFSIRHYEGEYNPYDGSSQKLIIEHTRVVSYNEWEKTYGQYMKLLEGETVEK